MKFVARRIPAVRRVCGALDFLRALARPAGWTVPDEGAAEAFAFPHGSTGARCGTMTNPAGSCTGSPRAGPARVASSVLPRPERSCTRLDPGLIPALLALRSVNVPRYG